MFDFATLLEDIKTATPAPCTMTSAQRIAVEIDQLAIDAWSSDLLASFAAKRDQDNAAITATRAAKGLTTNPALLALIAELGISPDNSVIGLVGSITA